MVFPIPILERVFRHRQAPNTQPVPHRLARGCVRVELMLGGRGWIQDGAAWRELGPGDIAWNAPGQLTIGRSDPDRPYSCLAANLRFPGRVPTVPRFSRAPDPGEARTFAEEVLRLSSDESFDRAILGHYLHARLRYWVETDQRRHREEQLPEPLRKVLAAMEQNFARRWRVPELARLAGWSSAHLHDAFRRSLEATPHQWLLRRRLRAVRERLISTPDPIKQIAAECGFADSASLAHAFRARYGLSPLAHRQNHLRVTGKPFILTSR